MALKTKDKTGNEWKKSLTNQQYHILREKGTEPAFSSKLDKNKKKGDYYCSACGNLLFSSKDKFDSGTGWPSFTKPDSEKSITSKKDFKLILPRTEVLCNKCGGHLGHVFNDGPKPTGKRYCINGIALKFKEKK